MNLLDTHIIVWWLQEGQEGGRLTPTQDAELQKVSRENPVAISSISLWELSMLHTKGRVKLYLPLAEFLSGLENSALVRVLPINAAVATAVSTLPETFHNDPADRIIVATAQVHGATLLTLDGPIFDSKLVPICR